MKYLSIFFTLFLFACSDSSQQPESADLIIHAGTLFNAVDGQTTLNQTIIIRDGRILEIMDRENFHNQYSAQNILDAANKFIMPGLIDTHTHVTAFVDDITEDKNGAPEIIVFTNPEYSKWHLRAMLYQGITSIRELGGFPEEAIALRALARSGEIIAPNIQVASKLLTEAPLIFPNIAREIISEDDARAYVHEMKMLGVDTIKLLFNLRPEFTQAAIDQAHKEGMLVAGHIRATTWREAFDMGIDSLVHTPFANPPMMDLGSEFVATLLNDMAAAGVGNDPTLIMRSGYYKDPHFLRDTQLPEVYESAPEGLKQNWLLVDKLSEAEYAPNTEMEDYHNEYVRRAFAAGIRLSTSSDTWMSWADYGNAIHQEIYMLNQAGIPNADVLMMATKNGAYQMRLDNDLGTIEIGKIADLLILDESPLEDIRNSRTFFAVIKDGKVVDRNALLN